MNINVAELRERISAEKVMLEERRLQLETELERLDHRRLRLGESEQALEDIERRFKDLRWLEEMEDEGSDSVSQVAEMIAGHQADFEPSEPQPVKERLKESEKNDGMALGLPVGAGDLMVPNFLKQYL